MIIFGWLNFDDILQDCIVISRDHHDVSGTDSPFRETSNIYDGSSLTAGEDIMCYKSDVK